MEKNRPFLVTSEEGKKLPILVMDKKGFLGAALADRLKEQFLVILVSGRDFAFHKNIIHIPYRKKIPVIPDNSYSHMFIFSEGEEEVLAMLPAFMKKANLSGGKVFFLSPLHHSSQALFRILSNHTYHSLKVILYGEVFDNQIRLGNMVNLFIHQARAFGRLEIPNEGLGKLYPIFIQDLIIALIASAFSHESRGRLVFIFPKVPFTEMSVARIFQKINPDIRIDFSKRKIKNLQYFIPDGGEYVFNSYSLEEGLRKIDLEIGEAGHTQVERKIEKPVKVDRFSFRIVLLVILTCLIAPLIFILLSALAGTAFLSQSVNEAEKGRFQSANLYADLGKVSFIAAETLGLNYIPADLLAPDAKAGVVSKLTTGREGADIGGDLFVSLNTFAKVYKNPEGSFLQEDFTGALSDAKNSLLKLEEIRAEGKLPKSVEQKLNKTRYMSSLLENTIDFLPEILGFEGEKNYLLLFQNNMELRPGGGFVGSYGLLPLSNGKSGKIEIHDVYDADGKLKTHVEPPFALRRYGGVSHWFLRDSNFDVDFTNNAPASADILKRATGQQVDGVIAIDTNFIKNILSVMGTVRVEDYKEDVSAENFYMLTQKHAEDNFFPGSTQKKDFLRALFNSVISELRERKNLSYLEYIKALEKSIKEKHLLLAFADPSIQRVFTVNNLSGALLDNREKKKNTYSDFFATFDANIGANKGNYYLKRSISQDVSITDTGELRGTATINFENTSLKNSKFGGDYKNYLRFVLPEGAELQAVRIDNRQMPIIEAITNPSEYTQPGFVPPSELEIESTSSGDKKVIGFFITVPVASSRKVAISYIIPQTVDMGTPVFSYNLRVFKQPGTVEDPYSLTLTYPSKYKPLDLRHGLVDLGGKLRLDTKLLEDKNIEIRFTQK